MFLDKTYFIGLSSSVHRFCLFSLDPHTSKKPLSKITRKKIHCYICCCSSDMPIQMMDEDIRSQAKGENGKLGVSYFLCPHFSHRITYQSIQTILLHHSWQTKKRGWEEPQEFLLKKNNEAFHFFCFLSDPLLSLPLSLSLSFSPSFLISLSLFFTIAIAVTDVSTCIICCKKNFRWRHNFPWKSWASSNNPHMQTATECFRKHLKHPFDFWVFRFAMRFLTSQFTFLLKTKVSSSKRSPLWWKCNGKQASIDSTSKRSIQSK